MLSKERMVELTREISGIKDIAMETKFAAAGIDSVMLVELLVEFEFQADRDILSLELDLDLLETLDDVYRLIEGASDGENR